MVIQKAHRGRLKLRKEINIVVLAMAFLAFAGCEQVQMDDETKGITVDFMEETVRETVYEGEAYSLIAEVRNEGRYDRPYGKVLLHGFDREIMPFSDLVPGRNVARVNLPEIPAKSEYMPEGGYENIEFSIPRNHIYIPYREPYSPTLVLSTCFYYETNAAPSVCIVPKPSELTSDSPCQPGTVRLQPQGAPVVVRSVEQEIQEGFVNFIVNIENVGGGRVVSPTSEGYDNCPSNLGYEDLNRVRVDLSIPNMPDPECTNEGIARLHNDRGSIHCKFQIRPDSYDRYTREIDTASYTQQLHINLKYYYTNSERKTIKVAKREGVVDERRGDAGREPGLIGDDGEREERVSGVSDSGSETGICRCDGSIHEPCVCLYYGGSEVFCHRSSEADTTVGERNPRFTIYGSDDSIRECGISGYGKTSCGSSKEYELGLGNGERTTINVLGYDENGNVIASQNCIIEREA